MTSTLGFAESKGGGQLWGTWPEFASEPNLGLARLSTAQVHGAPTCKSCDEDHESACGSVSGKSHVEPVYGMSQDTETNQCMRST